MTKLILLGRLLRSLGGETRLAILAFMKKNRSATVGKIAKGIRKSPNATSIHLAQLERLGILERRRRGHQVHYRLSLAQSAIVKGVLREI